MSRYVYSRRVQFAETDASGIVHFTNFFRYVEEAEHAMWRAAGLSIAPQASAVGWPRVAASFEYRKPLRFEDEFDVHVRISSTSSKTISYDAVLKMSDTVVAVARWTIICVRKASGGQPIRAIDIPSEIASRFEVAPDDSIDDPSANQPNAGGDRQRQRRQRQLPR
jgi:YbgC/YbaW family acyl-CoA thioester hydrolase